MRSGQLGRAAGGVMGGGQKGCAGGGVMGGGEKRRVGGGSDEVKKVRSAGSSVWRARGGKG